MKQFIFGFVFGVMVFSTTASGQQTFDNGFLRPWTDQRRALVLDGRYKNFLDAQSRPTVDWDEMKKDPRLAGVLLRSTGYDSDVGKVVADSQYQTIRKTARSHGFLWGSFHIGVSGPGHMSARDQADFYLKHIDNADDELIALDLEIIGGKQIMTIADAMIFVKRIFDRTGRFPVVYMPGSFHRDILETAGTGIFKNTPLWFGRSEDNIMGCMARGAKLGWWNTYALWQFASERNCVKANETYCETPPPMRPRPTVCPYDVSPNPMPMVRGVRSRDMDVNVFNGTPEELRKRWPFTFRKKK